MDGEIAASVALTLTGKIGDVRHRRLMEYFRSPSAAMEAPAEEFARAAEIPVKTAGKLISSLDLERGRQEVLRAQKAGVELIGIWEDRYPELLRDALGPPVLFIKGDPGCLYGPAVAIVGTRHPTPYGRDQARKLASQLAGAGIVIVSGLAYGIDSEAHRGSLQAGGRTVSVFGCGLATVYPKANEPLARKILDGGGALISEFPMGFPVRAENFPRRNRIISGLALGTLVVEAAKRSGALITASYSGEQGREIFALPGPVTSLQSMGVNALIQDGAKLVTCVEDIISELRLDLLPFARQAGEEISEERKDEGTADGGDDDTARRILSVLGDSVADAEELSRQTDMGLERISAALGMLELSGAVKRVPGGYKKS